MLNKIFSRRSFFRGAALGAFLLLSRPAWSALSDPEELPQGTLNLHNAHSNERMEITYRDEEGNYDPEALKKLNHFMRCHYSDKAIQMDIRMIEFLNLVDKKTGGGHEIEVVSAYRSPAYNQLLIKNGHAVAKHSYHTKGRAIDIRIPNIGLEILQRTALSLEHGGVGFYPDSGFIHLDSGPVRSW
ncbi:MAG TPA: DUF882 domain-containing protein [Nitrospiria bacterium]|nr:DUF882 domain-containing protein [Nitrospiria bacterium]